MCVVAAHGSTVGCCICSVAVATVPRGTYADPARTPAHTPPVQTDPEAARMVFESGVRLTMVPLEVRGLCSRWPGCLGASSVKVV